MLSLTKAHAPASVTVAGAFFAIKTDFRYWILFSQMLADENRLLTDFDFLYQDKIPENRKAGFDALFDFFVNKKELPRIFGESDSVNVLDYEQDSELIFAAFLEQYGIDLVDDNLHWHKFRALLSGLHGTKLNEVMGYRCYDENDKTDWKQAMKLNKKRWALPEKHTSEEQSALDEFDKLLSGGK